MLRLNVCGSEKTAEDERTTTYSGIYKEVEVTKIRKQGRSYYAYVPNAEKEFPTSLAMDLHGKIDAKDRWYRFIKSSYPKIKLPVLEEYVEHIL